MKHMLVVLTLVVSTLNISFEGRASASSQLTSTSKIARHLFLDSRNLLPPRSKGSLGTINVGVSEFGDDGPIPLFIEYATGMCEPNLFGTNDTPPWPIFSGTNASDFSDGGGSNSGGCISININYSGDEVAGRKTATYEGQYCVSDANNDCYTFTYDLVAAQVEQPEMCPADAPGSSMVNAIGQSVTEQVPLVGSSIFLTYASQFSPSYQSLTTDVYAFGAANFGFNNEGWGFSNFAFYDVQGSRLYLGTGQVFEVYNSSTTAGQYVIVDPRDGNSVFNFSPQGQLLSIQSALTGVTVYKFGYTTYGTGSAAQAKVTTMTDRAGNVSTIGRNSLGQAISFTAPRGQLTTFGLNSSGFLSSVKNPNNETYLMTYSAATGQLATFTKPGGQLSTFSYDANGHLTKDLGFGGNFLSVISPSAGTFTQSTEMGRSTTFSSSYDNSTSTTTRTETDPSGLVTTNTGSNTSQLNDGPILARHFIGQTDARFGIGYFAPGTITVKAAGLTSTTTYTQALTQGSGVGFFNYQTLQTKATTSGRVTTSTFTNATKTKVDSSPMGVNTTTVYDSLERPTSVKLGSDIATALTYDTYGRLATSAQGTQNKYTYAYDSLGNLHTVTNGRSEVMTFAYDLSGRKTSTTLPDTRVIAYSYDHNGNLTGVTPPSKPLHSLFYNAMELTSEYTAPTVTGVNSNTTYTYNLDRQLTQITLPSTGTVVYNYDATTGLLSNYVTDVGTYTYNYSASYPGLVHSIHGPYNMQNDFNYHGYDVASNVQTRESDGMVFGTVTYGYDTDHRITSRTLQGTTGQPTSTQNYTLNNDGNPSVAGAETLTYDPTSGRLSTTTLGIVSDSYTYDAYGNISSYTAKYTPSGGSPTTLYSYTLTRDNMSRVTGKSETVSGTTSTYVYNYDTAARLTSATKNGSNIASFVYDSNSNRTSVSLQGGAASTLVYDAQDRLTNYGSTVISYDANGNLIKYLHSDGTNSNFVYDNLGNLKQLTGKTGNVFTYGYDGRNQLNWLVENGSTLQQRLVYDGHGNLVAEETGTGVIGKEFVYGVNRVPDYMIYGGVNYKLISDYQGTVKMAVNSATGAVSELISYDVVGEVLSDSNAWFQPFGFAGGVYDQYSQYVHFGARWYDPSTGRWTSKDPIRFKGGDTNLYGYVLNDPINLVDPDGKSTSGEAYYYARYVEDLALAKLYLMEGNALKLCGDATGASEKFALSQEYDERADNDYYLAGLESHHSGPISDPGGMPLPGDR